MSESLPPEAVQLPAESVGPAQYDYFGFGEERKFLFPDGITYISYEVMNEDRKSRFQKETQRDVVVERNSGNARMKGDPATERHALIEASVNGWNLVRGPERRAVPFNRTNLLDFVKSANPKLIEDLETELRKANPWLLGEMSVEDIDREIDSLKEMRDVAEKRDREKGSSSSK